MKTHAITTALCGLLLAVPTLRAQEPKKAPPAKSSYSQDSPESALRSFYLAMVLSDEPALQRLTLPAEGFEWLLKGDHITPDQAEEYRDGLDRIVLSRLKAGD
jgi:hypothetical protein